MSWWELADSDLRFALEKPGDYSIVVGEVLGDLARAQGMTETVAKRLQSEPVYSPYGVGLPCRRGFMETSWGGSRAAWLRLASALALSRLERQGWRACREAVDSCSHQPRRSFGRVSEENLHSSIVRALLSVRRLSVDCCVCPWSGRPGLAGVHTANR